MEDTKLEKVIESSPSNSPALGYLILAMSIGVTGLVLCFFGMILSPILIGIPLVIIGLIALFIAGIIGLLAIIMGICEIIGFIVGNKN